jgi:histidine decarboxylase
MTPLLGGPSVEDIFSDAMKGSTFVDGALPDRRERRPRMHSPRSQTAPALSLVGRPPTRLLACATTVDAGMATMLAELRERVATHKPYTIGFPAAVDVDWSPLTALLTGGLLNNVGSPAEDGNYACHTKPMERDVVATLATLFRAPQPHRGHITDGASSATLWALHQARQRFPHAVVYHSQAAHFSVPKACALLGMPAVTVRADDAGEIDYEDLRRHLAAYPEYEPVIIANIGTTMTEAHDDVRRIAGLLKHLGVTDRWIHADAALSGIPLALLDPTARPGLDFSDGADSLVVSGHKFLGTLRPCAVVLARTALVPRTGPRVPYIDAYDETLGCSRDGHAALMLWWVLHTFGPDGLRRRAEASRSLAAYTLSRLDALGWTAFRNPNAFTVVLKEPPAAVARRWNLPTQDGWSHIVCMPGVTRKQIDDFVGELQRCVTLQGCITGQEVD